MKRTIPVPAVIIIAFVIAFTSQSCSKKHGVGLTEPANKYTVQSLEPKKGNNVFAGDFYTACRPDDTSNVFFSPYSIFSALSMTFEGAKNSTADQMAAVLHLPADETARRNGFAELMGTINAPGKSYSLSTSNNLWLQNDFNLYPSYTSVLGAYYQAAITNLDFVGAPEPSRQTINNAVAGQTNNKITNLIPQGAITLETRLILTNAIYMKADWAVKFDANHTFPGDFFVDAGTTVQPQLMNQEMGGHVEDYYGKAQVMELPYVNNELSMFVFLPPQGQMAALEGLMTGDKLNSWFADRVTNTAGLMNRVAVTLPKFEFTADYTLTTILAGMGMTDAFSRNSADFSGMAPISADKRLFISDVIHKAFISVGEDGTEAAATTAVIIGITTSISVPEIIQPEVFRADHPFIFVIRENTTNAVLFMGRVIDPTR